MRCIAYRLKCGIVVSNDQSVLGYSHRAWISYGVYCFFIESWGSCVSQSHDDRPHTPWLRRSQHGPTAHVTSSFACHNNSSRTSYTMSESEIRSQTRHKYPTCIRACVIVHMRLQQSQHGPLRASRRLRGTSVRNTTQEPRSTHLCATHASAHYGATHASKAHLGPRTRGVNILQPVTPHSTPPLDGPHGRKCLPLPWYGKRIRSKRRVSSGKRTQAVPKQEEGFVGKRAACKRRVSSETTACKRRVSSPRSMIPIVAP